MWKCPSIDAKEVTQRRAETDRFRKKNDPCRKMYNTSAWFRFRWFVLNRNPICQRIVKGVQCRDAATVVHHLLSPRQRPDLFLEPTNVLCLCAGCHPGGEEGTPLWRVDIDYVPSVIEGPTAA
jgi:5-methylcytosine-specific restriction enzyme A